MTKVDSAQFAKIPFINHVELAGRFVCSLLFYDGSWQAWIQAGDQLLETRMWPAEAMYFGKRAEQEADIRLHFLDIMGQRLNHLPISRQLFALQDDIFNLSASLAKIQLIQRRKEDHKHGVSRMVATEVEYLHNVCRSMFDLWQEVIGALWDHIRLADPSAKKNHLPRTYREMVMSDNKLRTSGQLAKKFPGVPPALVECYIRSGTFFADLRNFRDRIVHQGAGVDVIFDGDEDFLISEARVRFRDVNIWEEKDRKPNGLVPLTPAIGFVIYRTLETFDHFSRTIETIFQLPAPLVPKFHLVLRGYFNGVLADTLEDVEKRLGPRTQT